MSKRLIPDKLSKREETHLTPLKSANSEYIKTSFDTEGMTARRWA